MFDCGEHPLLRVAQRLVAHALGRLHREQRDHLEEVVLHDVSEAADLLVERAATLHAEVLGHGDLDARDVVAVPDRLEERIREPEVEDVLDLFLPEEVVDPVDGRFREHGVDDLVELDRARQVAAERLLDDDSGVLGRAELPQRLDHLAEQARRDREVVRRCLRAPTLSSWTFSSCERRRIRVVAVHVVQGPHEVVPRLLVRDRHRRTS